MTVERLNKLLASEKVGAKAGFARIDKNNYPDSNCEELKNTIVEYIEEVAIDCANCGYSSKITGNLNGDVSKALKDLTEIAVLLSEAKAPDKINNYRKKFDECKATIMKCGPKNLSYSLKDEMRTYLAKSERAIDLILSSNNLEGARKESLENAQKQLDEITNNLLENVIDASSPKALESYNKVNQLLHKFGEAVAARDYTSSLGNILNAVSDQVELWAQYDGCSKIDPTNVVTYATDKTFRIRNIIVANEQQEKFINFKFNLDQNLQSYMKSKEDVSVKNATELEYEALEDELAQKRALYNQNLLSKEKFLAQCTSKIARFKELTPRIQKYQLSRKTRVALFDAKIELVRDIEDNIVDIESNMDYPVLFSRLCKIFPINELSNLLVGEKADKQAIQLQLSQFRAMANKITEDYMIEARSLFEEAEALGNEFHNRFTLEVEETPVKQETQSVDDLLAEFDNLGIGSQDATETEVQETAEEDELNILDDIEK